MRILLLALSVLPFVASAGPLPLVYRSTGELLRTCQDNSPVAQIACASYLMGVLGGIETEQDMINDAFQTPELFCRTKTENGRDLVRIVLGEAAVEAAAGNLNAQDPPDTLIYLAYMKAFPCKR